MISKENNKNNQHQQHQPPPPITTQVPSLHIHAALYSVSPVTRRQAEGSHNVSFKTGHICVRVRAVADATQSSTRARVRCNAILNIESHTQSAVGSWSVHHHSQSRKQRTHCVQNNNRVQDIQGDSLAPARALCNFAGGWDEHARSANTQTAAPAAIKQKQERDLETRACKRSTANNETKFATAKPTTLTERAHDRGRQRALGELPQITAENQFTK